MEFEVLIREAKKHSGASAQPVKLAVLGDHVTTFMVRAIKAAGILNNIAFQIYEAEYDQTEMELYNDKSGLYLFQPDFIFMWHSALKLQQRFYNLPIDGKIGFAVTEAEKITSWIDTIKKNGLQSRIIYCNYEFLNDSVFGNHFSKVRESFYFQLYRLNYELLNLSASSDVLYILDVNGIIKSQPAEQVRNWSLYINSDLHYSLDFYSKLAVQLSGYLASFTGKFKKCLILDLDNTLWGGIIGDDGIQNIQVGTLGIGKAFVNFQKWIKQLNERGIILAVCSKNNEEVAKDVFRNHPEMVLTLDDISVFVANWENKADNIRFIQSVLNIGFDSMVFIDDNPVERDFIRQSLPEVLVPELPEDPALYLNYLMELNVFETGSYSINDKDRTRQYKEEAERKKLETVFNNIDEYLQSLCMECTLEPFDAADFSRLAQLSQRSNQFNLRTIRYTESDIEVIGNDKKFLTYSVKLRDKFGDYGLISMVVVKLLNEEKAFIETWLMSCRVLKRNVERFVLNFIVEDLKSRKINYLEGEYLPTLKNGLVKDHYRDLGFTEENGRWILKIENYQPVTTNIKNVTYAGV